VASPAPPHIKKLEKSPKIMKSRAVELFETSCPRGDDVDSGEKPPSATNKNAFEMTTRHRQFVSPQRVFQKYEEGKMIIDNDTERTERRQEATARVESLLDEAEDLITSIKIELLREHQE